MCYYLDKRRIKMKRATINASTFSKIFSERTDVLEMLAASFMKMDRQIFKNNITCSLDEVDKCDYFISMPDDDVIKIKNIKTSKEYIFYLKK